MNPEVTEAETAPPPQPEGEPLPDQFVPPEVVIYRPSAANVVKPGDGTVQFEFMISPLKVIAVNIPEEAGRELASQMNSGIVVAQSMPAPAGRRPQ